MARSIADKLLPFALTDLTFNLSLLIYFKHQLHEANNKQAYESVESVETLDSES